MASSDILLTGIKASFIVVSGDMRLDFFH